MAFFGFAMLLSVMINKKNTIFFFMGFVLAAYSGLDLTALAIISIIAAILLYQIRYDGVLRPQTEGASADMEDEYDELED